MKRILACDDSLTIRRLVSMAVEAENLELELAVNAAEGVAKATANPPDLMLLDFMLPDGTGLDVIKKLARSSKTEAIRVVLMSASSAEVADEVRRQPAVVGVLPKPFKPNDLCELLCEQGVIDAAPAAASSMSVKSDVGSDGKSVEALAMALYDALKAELASLPELIRQKGGQCSTAELAKRLLRPSVVSRLHGALLSLYGGSAASGLSTLSQARDELNAVASGFSKLMEPMSFRRAQNFGQKIKSVPVTDRERKLLAVTDPRTSYRELRERIGFDEVEMMRAVAGAARVGLLRTTVRASVEPGSRYAVRDVLMVGRNGKLHQELDEHLQRRSRPCRVSSASFAEFRDALERQPADAIVLAPSLDDDAESTIAALRADAQLADLPIAVILPPGDARAAQLTECGADDVWSEPVLLDRVDAFFTNNN